MRVLVARKKVKWILHKPLCLPVSDYKLLIVKKSLVLKLIEKKKKMESCTLSLMCIYDYPTSAGSSKKQDSSRRTSISALLTMPKPLTVWITINWKILKEMGILDHLICVLRNLYAGQETTVRTGHGTTDWFQIGKGVRQGCLLSPC